MSPTVHHVTSAAALDQLVAHATLAGAGFAAELFAAARQGNLAVAYLMHPCEPAPMKMLKRCARPAIAILGSDMGGIGARPAEWVALRRLASWARFALIHGSGGSVETYKLAVQLTRIHGRLLMVECSSARAPEWATALRGHKPRPVPCVAVLPTSGAHPIQARPEART